MLNRRRFLALTLALPLLPACGSKQKHVKIAQGRKIIALGDSLTFGYGATPDTAYPTILAAKTGWDIINAGVNGDTSEGVLARLDDVITQAPSLVLLGIGGNDVLRRIAPATTENNIRQIVQQLKSAAIDVVLIAEPYFSASALLGIVSDNPVYASIAKAENVPLFAKGNGGWSDILSNEALKSDQIHANAQGYAKFADNLYQFLADQGFI